MLETLCKTQISQNILDDKQKQQYIGKFFLKTYGCQMNEYDSQKMAKMVDELGLTKCNSIQDADLIIINTCHIREKATEKLYSELGRIRKTKKPEAKIVVAGCVAQAEGEEVIRRTEGLVELIIGPQSIHLLPGLVYKALSNQTFNPINLDFPGMDKFDVIPESQYNHGINGHLTIQEGCDKFCKFCCVPYTRGAHGLDENNNNCNLGRLLLEYISKIPQFVRIFYTTSHPNDMHDELYEAHRKIKNLIPFVHLPIQSGSNKILKDMNRKHTKEEYIEIINKLRENRPDIQFSTDIIVGYPGETDEDFQDTYDLVESVKYAQSYIFKYSPRIGTPAASRTDQVEKQVVDERFQRLKILVDKQQMEINKTFVEKKLEVLFEKINENNQLVGRSQYMQLVFANVTEDYDANMIGKIANVKITRAFGHSLLGDVV